MAPADHKRYAAAFLARGLEMTRLSWLRLVAYPTVAVATLGAIGFACGFYGPLALNPEANQGPLLGIFISGPLGLGAGAFLGMVAAILRLRRAAFVLTLTAAGIVVGTSTLYYSLPKSRWQGFVIDAEIHGCTSADPFVAAAVARWETSNPPWNTPRLGWKEDVPRMLRADRGVVLTLLVHRRADISEEQKPWNRGRLTTRRLSGPARFQPYFARFAGPSCADYSIGTRRLFAPRWEASNVSPPDVLPTLLGLHVLADVPTAFLGAIEPGGG
jgi:hypothetical protein